MTWRQLLQKILALPNEKERIAQEMQLSSPRQLEKWAYGSIKPHPDNLKSLLQTIPSSYRTIFSELLSVDFPEVVGTFLLSSSPPDVSHELVWQILTALGETVMPESIQDHILLRMAQHLDRERVGIILIVALAKLSENQSAYMELNPSAAFGTGVWSHQPFLAQRMQGESLISSVVQSRVQVMIDEYHLCSHDISWLYAYRHIKSLHLLPLLRMGRTAGTMIVGSTQPNLFDERKLIEHYTLLLALAYRDTQFHDPKEYHFQPSHYQNRENVLSDLDSALAALSHLPLSEQEFRAIVQQRLHAHYQERSSNAKEGK